MGNRAEERREREIDNFKRHQRVFKNLSAELNIPDLRSHYITIRDDRNWRVNEKRIEYCWIVNISRSFVGWCWLFSIKFEANEFREHKNEEQLIQGLFTLNKECGIDQCYKICKTHDFHDGVKELKSYDLFEANAGFTVDGVGYEFWTFTFNNQMRFSLNNPQSEGWKVWEKEVWKIGRELAEQSGSQYFKDIFE